MDGSPRGQVDDELHAGGDPFAPDVFAEWITEDVVQRLYASRQDIADAVIGMPGPDFGAEWVRDRLLGVIGNLRELATHLLASPEAHASPQDVARLADEVAHECESARVLIAQCAAALSQDRRIRAEEDRLARDGSRLQRASAAVGAASHS